MRFPIFFFNWKTKCKKKKRVSSIQMESLHISSDVIASPKQAWVRKERKMTKHKSKSVWIHVRHRHSRCWTHSNEKTMRTWDAKRTWEIWKYSHIAILFFFLFVTFKAIRNGNAERRYNTFIWTRFEHRCCFVVSFLCKCE